MTFIGKSFQQRGLQLGLENFVGSAVFRDHVEKLDSLYKVQSSESEVCTLCDVCSSERRILSPEGGVSGSEGDVYSSKCDVSSSEDGACSSEGGVQS